MTKPVETLRAPCTLPLYHQQERGLHVGQYWMQIWGVSGVLLDAN